MRSKQPSALYGGSAGTPAQKVKHDVNGLVNMVWHRSQATPERLLSVSMDVHQHLIKDMFWPVITVPGSVKNGGSRDRRMAGNWSIPDLPDSFSPSRIVKPIRSKLRIANGMLDVLMAQIVLNSAYVMAFVGQVEPAGLAEHMVTDGGRSLPSGQPW